MILIDHETVHEIIQIEDIWLKLETKKAIYNFLEKLLNEWFLDV